MQFSQVCAEGTNVQPSQIPRTENGYFHFHFFPQHCWVFRVGNKQLNHFLYWEARVWKLGSTEVYPTILMFKLKTAWDQNLEMIHKYYRDQKRAMEGRLVCFIVFVNVLKWCVIVVMVTSSKICCAWIILLKLPAVRRLFGFRNLNCIF